MVIERTGQRSRRALLAGAVGGLAAVAAEAIARPAQVAADDEPILLGHEYTTARMPTRLRNEANANTVFVAEAAGTTKVPGGTAISGIGDTVGLHASSQNGTAVAATSFGGVGVDARALGPAGYGLVTRGRIKLATSGVATIPANQTSVMVNPGVDITPASFVLLTPKVNLGGRSLWFTIDPGSFTIRISTSRTKATKVS